MHFHDLGRCSMNANSALSEVPLANGSTHEVFIPGVGSSVEITVLNSVTTVTFPLGIKLFLNFCILTDVQSLLCLLHGLPWYCTHLWEQPIPFRGYQECNASSFMWMYTWINTCLASESKFVFHNMYQGKFIL